MKTQISKDKEVIFLIGPPGVGKSTWVQTACLYRHVECSTDAYFMKKAVEKGITYDEAFRAVSFKEAESSFKNKIKAAVNQGESVIIDRTNLTRKGRAKMKALFDESYHVVYVLFDFSDRAALEARLEQRKQDQGKTISKKTLDQMLEMYQEPTEDEYDELIRINNFS